jgi:hypothetical protein
MFQITAMLYQPVIFGPSLCVGEQRQRYIGRSPVSLERGFLLLLGGIEVAYPLAASG